MATRFYLESDTTVSPTPSYDSNWNSSSSSTAVRRLLRKSGNRSASSLANGTYHSFTVSSSANWLDRQYISDPLVAGNTFSTSVTVKGYARMHQKQEGDNVNVILSCIKILHTGGTTTTLLDWGSHGGTSELYVAPSALRNHILIASGTNLSPSETYQTVDGDRLLFEFGYNCYSGTGTAEPQTRFGSNAGSDLPEDETTTSDYNPWIEFSHTVTTWNDGKSITTDCGARFYTLPTLSLTGGSVVTSTGTATLTGGCLVRLADGTATLTGGCNVQTVSETEYTISLTGGGSRVQTTGTGTLTGGSIVVGTGTATLTGGCSLIKPWFSQYTYTQLYSATKSYADMSGVDHDPDDGKFYVVRNNGVYIRRLNPDDGSDYGSVATLGAPFDDCEALVRCNRGGSNGEWAALNEGDNSPADVAIVTFNLTTDGTSVTDATEHTLSSITDVVANNYGGEGLGYDPATDKFYVATQQVSIGHVWEVDPANSWSQTQLFALTRLSDQGAISSSDLVSDLVHGSQVGRPESFFILCNNTGFTAPKIVECNRTGTVVGTWSLPSAKIEGFCFVRTYPYDLFLVNDTSGETNVWRYTRASTGTKTLTGGCLLSGVTTQQTISLSGGLRLEGESETEYTVSLTGGCFIKFVDKIVVPYSSVWAYKDDGGNWYSAGFYGEDYDVSGWATGTAVFHGGASGLDNLPSGATIQTTIQNPTTASRAYPIVKTITCPAQPDHISSIVQRAVCDDGIVVWVNGNITQTVDAPGTITDNCDATGLTGNEGAPQSKTLSQTERGYYKYGNTRVAMYGLDRLATSTDCGYALQIEMTYWVGDTTDKTVTLTGGSRVRVADGSVSLTGGLLLSTTGTATATGGSVVVGTGSKSLAGGVLFPYTATRQIICGFESGSDRELLSVAGTYSYSTNPVRTGSYSFRVNPGTSSIGYCRLGTVNASGYPSNMASLTNTYCQFAFRVATAPGTGYEPIVKIWNTTLGAKGYITIDSDRKLSFRNSVNTILSTTSDALSLDTWYVIQFSIGTGSSANYELRIDGAQNLSGTGNFLTYGCEFIEFGKTNVRSSQAVDYYFDDIIIDSAALPPVTSRVKQLKPDGNGTYTGWTASTGEKYQCVDDVQPIAYKTTDTDYISTSSAEAYSATLESCSTAGITGDIKCAVLRGWTNTYESTRSGRLILRSSDAEVKTDTVSWETSTQYWSHAKIVQLNPSDHEAWTTADLDGCEVGVEVVGGSGSGYATKLCLSVEYTGELERTLSLTGGCVLDTGGETTGTISLTGGGALVQTTGTGTLTGGLLARLGDGTATATGGLLASTTGTATLTGGLLAQTSGTIPLSGGLLVRLADGTATLTGGLLTRTTGTLTPAGGLLASTQGTISLTGGLLAIPTYSLPLTGGLLAETSGTVALSGGLLVRFTEDGTATLTGGLLAQTTGTVPLTGGSLVRISDGTATLTGGSVVIPTYSLPLTGGLLAQTTGTATLTGGVALQTTGEGTIPLTGGLLAQTTGTLSPAGGLLSQTTGTATLTGGSVVIPTYSIPLTSGASVRLSDGTETLTGGLLAQTTGTATLTGGLLVRLADGTATLTGGLLTRTTGTETLTGGSVVIPTYSLPLIGGLLAQTTGTATLTGGVTLQTTGEGTIGLPGGLRVRLATDGTATLTGGLRIRFATDGGATLTGGLQAATAGTETLTGGLLAQVSGTVTATGGLRAQTDGTATLTGGLLVRFVVDGSATATGGLLALTTGTETLTGGSLVRISDGTETLTGGLLSQTTGTDTLAGGALLDLTVAPLSLTGGARVIPTFTITLTGGSIVIPAYSLSLTGGLLVVTSGTATLTGGLLSQTSGTATLTGGLLAKTTGTETLTGGVEVVQEGEGVCSLSGGALLRVTQTISLLSGVRVRGSDQEIGLANGLKVSLGVTVQLSGGVVAERTSSLTLSGGLKVWRELSVDLSSGLVTSGAGTLPLTGGARVQGLVTVGLTGGARVEKQFSIVLSGGGSVDVPTDWIDTTLDVWVVPRTGRSWVVPRVGRVWVTQW